MHRAVYARVPVRHYEDILVRIEIEGGAAQTVAEKAAHHSFRAAARDHEDDALFRGFGHEDTHAAYRDSLPRARLVTQPMTILARCHDRAAPTVQPCDADCLQWVVPRHVRRVGRRPDLRTVVRVEQLDHCLDGSSVDALLRLLSRRELGRPCLVQERQKCQRHQHRRAFRQPCRGNPVSAAVIDLDGSALTRLTPNGSNCVHLRGSTRTWSPHAADWCVSSSCNASTSRRMFCPGRPNCSGLFGLAGY